MQIKRGDCGGRDAGMRRGLWGKGCRDEERGLWGKGCREGGQERRLHSEMPLLVPLLICHAC